MSKIKILPEQVANQIAAGEVVERPASVVKEFLENAIDAGANHLAVQVEGNGTRLIRIVDDGEGMDQDDVLLCLERHATSKLSGEKQLTAIRTLGFRGEAVPSIASVAILTITSRPAASSLGTRAEIRYGKLTKVHEMGCGQGTTMELRDLFGNVPARRKFLKTAQTELAHIEEVLKSYALANPRLGFNYMVNGREIFSLPAGVDTLEQRLRTLLGRRSSGPLVKIAAGREDESRLTGYLLPPEDVTGSARLSLFVNGRAVRDRLLAHAVSEGLRSFLMQGRRPAGALFLEISPEEVDVNVHPAKQEVRFREPSRVHHLVATAVAKAMAFYQQEVKRSLFELPSPESVEETTGDENRYSSRGWAPAPLSSHRLSEPEPEEYPTAGEKVLLPEHSNSFLRAEAAPIFHAGRAVAAPVVTPDGGTSRGEDFAGRETVVAPPSFLRLLGQLSNSYLLCESSAGLVIIDQHAAHERLLFEQLKKQYCGKKIVRQTLLFPKMVELQPEQLDLINRYHQELEQLGVELQEFGGSSQVIKAVPALLAHLAPEEILADILDHYAALESESRRGSSRSDTVLANMACKAAIKAGQPLKAEESAALLRQMHESPFFTHCSHGRPVMKCFSINDIKKWFHRT
jgi:DNA mismatch repair protein MutL